MRQNVEDWWYKDRRRDKLIIHLYLRIKDPDLAIDVADGAAQRARTLAQRYWIPHQKLIPLADWKSQNIPEEFLTVGLAEIRPEGVYVKGTQDAFAEWFKRRQKKVDAGALGAAASAAKVTRDSSGRFVTKEESPTEPPTWHEEVPPSDDAQDAACLGQRDIQASAGHDRAPPGSARAEPGRHRAPPGLSNSNSSSSDLNSKILSLPESFDRRLKSQPTKLRERELEIFRRLVREDNADPDELAELIESIAARGNDLAGKPILSLMGYLETALSVELEAFRSDVNKRRRAEARRESEKQKQAERQRAENELALKQQERERAFQAEFATPRDQEIAIAEYSRGLNLKDRSGPLARAYAIGQWWEKVQRKSA